MVMFLADHRGRVGCDENVAEDAGWPARRRAQIHAMRLSTPRLRCGEVLEPPIVRKSRSWPRPRNSHGGNGYVDESIIAAPVFAVAPQLHWEGFGKLTASMSCAR